jgi:ubiquinol-cytochrome c reductase cytochrome b subunit
MAVAAVGLGVLVYGALTVAGFSSDWVPVSTEGASLPAAALGGLGPQEATGARLFVQKDCFACHQIAGAGGRRGPQLGDVATRLSHDQIVTVILNGKGQAMPSFAGAFTPQELADRGAFLDPRRGPYGRADRGLSAEQASQRVRGGGNADRKRAGRGGPRRGRCSRC